jgi:cation transport ATPase
VYWESAAVTLLFLLGGWLETQSLNKTRSTLKDLLNMVQKFRANGVQEIMMLTGDGPVTVKAIA